MSVEIKILTVNGLTLNTKNKYVKDDIAITLDLPKYDGSFINVTSETLPSGYTQLMYIESTGEQYIDTEFNMTTASELELTIAVTEYNTKAKMGFLGSYETNSTLYQLYASGTGNAYFYATFGGKNFTALSKFELNTLYNIVMKASTITINSVPQNFTSDGLSDATKPLYLFWRNETGEKAKMKLYSCNIYNNNVAVRKFIPCSRNEDNAIGLYDLVTEKFYENKGTGTFIGG
jgi:hypothetical protein